IAGVSRPGQGEPVVATEELGYGIERRFQPSIVAADAGHGGEALRLDEDPAFLVAAAADLVAVRVVRTQEPVAVPGGLVDRRDHAADGGIGTFSFLRQP